MELAALVVLRPPSSLSIVAPLSWSTCWSLAPNWESRELMDAETAADWLLVGADLGFFSVWPVV